MRCPHCGTEAETDAKFCRKCGTTLGRTGAEGERSSHEGEMESIERRWLRVRHKRFATLLIIFVFGFVVLAAGAPGLFLLAIAPSSYLLWHFYHVDKYKRESTRLLLGTFALGGASTLVAIVIEPSIALPGISAGIIPFFLYILFDIGLVEESCKFVSVRIYAYRSVHFDEAMDGIVFGIAAGLGFATIENILFVFQNGIATGFYRALVSVPGHAFWGAIIGYYLGEAKVHNKPSLAFQGLAIAAFLHGLFDTLAFAGSDIVTTFILLPGLVWIVYFRVIKKEIAKAEEESPLRAPPPPP